ncbi:MAG: SDR family oxidoreductase [Candidatus Kryptoniota bacterium]
MSGENGNWLLVLGAASDIARAASRTFARHGWNLYLASRSTDDLERDASDIRLRFGVKVDVIFFDAVDFKSHIGFYNSLNPKPLVALIAFGYLGSSSCGDPLKLENNLEEIKKIVETNFLGGVSIAEVIAFDFSQRKAGTIIGISSVAGDRGKASNCVYGASKSGMTAYLSGLRNKLFQYGVSVITIKPGYVRTKMTAGMALPALLTADPEHVGESIWKAFKRKKDVVYVKGIWRLIMLIVRLIPEKVFKRLKV